MKSERLYEAIGDMEETYVNEAHAWSCRPHWHKWGVVVACLALLLLAVTFHLPMKEEAVMPLPSEEATHFSEAYFYHIDDGAFASYMSGKVIDESKIGEKIQDVTLTAGWRNNAGDWLTTEHLRGEIYLISGISKEIAVALKFLDKGDALTITHYYTILNPQADLSSVLEYYITPLLPVDGHIPPDHIQTTVSPDSADGYVEGVTETSGASE